MAMADYIRSMEDSAKKNKLQAYFYGYLNHYAMDRRIHPYVYFNQFRFTEAHPKYSRCAHVLIETEIDRYLWKKLEKGNINRFPYRKYYKKDKELFAAVGQMFSHVYDVVYGETVDPNEIAYCFVEMRRYTRLFYSPTGFVHLLCQVADKILNFGGILASHTKRGHCPYDFMNEDHQPWHHPWRQEEVYTTGVWDIFTNAAAEGGDIATAFDRYITDGTPIPHHLSITTAFSEGCGQKDLDLVNSK